MSPQLYLDFSLTSQILAMLNSCKDDVEDVVIPQDLNPTYHTLLMDYITLLYQWEGSFIGSLVALNINVTYVMLGFQPDPPNHSNHFHC